MEQAPLFVSPFVLDYTYRRSLGPVIGRFLTSLREGRLEGVRTPRGQVLVPPTEYDPLTGEAVGDFVEVGPEGTVVTWTWEASPRERHPLATPFAWALIQLDGADTSLLHVVEAKGPDAMRSGLRVRVRWAEERVGHIRDIACFEVVP